MVFSAVLFSYTLTFNDQSLLSGQTQQVENDQFQAKPLPIFIYYTPLPVNGLQLDADESSRTYLFVTSIDEKQSRAKQSFDYGNKFLIPVVSLSEPALIFFFCSQWTRTR